MSGFIPRHIEQPASRHSKPAAVKTRPGPRLRPEAHLLRSRHHHRPDRRRHRAAVDDPRQPRAERRCELVQEPMKTRRVGSRYGRAGLQPHVGERALRDIAVGRHVVRPGRGSLGHLVTIAAWCPRSPSARSSAASTRTSLSKARRRRVSWRQRSTAASKSSARPAARDVAEGGLVGGDHPGAGAALDRHVANRHPSLHRQGGSFSRRKLTASPVTPPAPISPIDAGSGPWARRRGGSEPAPFTSSA